MFVACILKLYRFLLSLRGITIIAYTPLSEATQSLGPGPPQSKDCYTLFTSLATVSLIMFYFFVCDRTNFFMKENKYYSEFSFWIPVGYMCVLGLFFTDDSRYTKVLHQDQTDESKGWMQLVILIYHMTGASQVLPIYMVVHLLISGYLFLAGYSHFSYVWKTGDFSIVRLGQVMFRFNFVTFVLCLCMNRPYQFYDFIPTLSFWCVMLYFVLAIPPQISLQSSEGTTLQYLYLVIKFVVFFSIITILYMSEVFFEKVFVTRPWKALFVTIDDDIRQWWSRWKIDRYSISYGSVFAIIYCIAQRYNLVEDNNHSNLFPKRIALTVTLFALMALGSYTTFIFLCRNQLECNEIQAYINLVPIISYLALRNISGVLRSRYSSLFAWFGKIYLELFISQSHIWLAADTHGVLVLIPSYPVLNVIVTSFIYVCASHELHRLTNILLPYAVPSDWKLVLRNLVLFVAVLVPIGYQAGMF